MLIATPSAGAPGRNLGATTKVRLGIGPTRDFVTIGRAGRALAAAEIPDAVAAVFPDRSGFDPNPAARSSPSPFAFTRGESERGAGPACGRAARRCTAASGESLDWARSSSTGHGPRWATMPRSADGRAWQLSYR